MKTTTTVLDVLGLAAVVAGAALVFWPAAIIVFGLAVLFVSRQLAGVK